MKSLKKQLAITLVAVLAVGAVSIGCNKSDMDKAADKTKDAASDAKDAVKDAASATGEAVKDAAVTTKDAVTNAVGSMTSTNK